MKRLLFYVASLVLLISILAEGGETQLVEKKVIMVIANKGYRKEELEIPSKMLKDAGVTVKIASTSLNVASGYPGVTAKPDMVIDDLRAEDFDAIILVGGPGASCYWNDSRVHQLVKNALNSGKLVGAICIAPVTLANAGVLNGKKATVFSSEAAALKKGGAVYTRPQKGVEIDGRIVTADGPNSASEFGKVILEKLKE